MSQKGATLANSSNPFDFSDFQTQGVAGDTTDGSAAADRGFGSSSSDGGFDPFADSPSTGSQFGSPSARNGISGRFDESQPSAPTVTADVASPPVIWCSAAGLAALTGLVLAVLGISTFELALVGWALAGPLSIGLLAVHTTMDTKKRVNAFYSQPGWAAPLYWTVMVIAFVGVAISAWSIADWVGRQ